MKQTILNFIEDGVSDLPVDAIDKMVREGDITIEEMVEVFEKSLRKGISL